MLSPFAVILSPFAVILSEDFMILRLTTVHENGLPGARQGLGKGGASAPPLRSRPSPPPLSRWRERWDHEVVGEGPYGGAEAPPFPRHFHGSEGSL